MTPLRPVATLGAALGRRLRRLVRLALLVVVAVSVIAALDALLLGDSPRPES